MRKPTAVGLTTLLSLVATGTGRSFQDAGYQGAAAQRVSIAWKTQGPTENPFRAVGGMVGAPDGAVFIADPEAVCVYRFEPSTGAFSLFDRRGQGPGELNMPQLVTLTPEGNVAVYDMGRRMILVYSVELDPLRQVAVQRFITNPKGFGFLLDGSFIISGGAPSVAVSDEPAHGVHRFDGRDGHRIEQLVRLPEPRNMDERSSLAHIAGGPVFALPEGGFLYSNSAPHRIVRFDANLVQRELAADPSVVGSAVDTFATEYFNEERQTMAWKYDWFHDQARGIYRLRDGHILSIITRRNHDSSTWELFNGDGDLVERFDVGTAWRPYGLTSSEEVLVAYDDPVSGENEVAALRWR